MECLVSLTHTHTHTHIGQAWCVAGRRAFNTAGAELKSDNTNPTLFGTKLAVKNIL